MDISREIKRSSSDISKALITGACFFLPINKIFNEGENLMKRHIGLTAVMTAWILAFGSGECSTEEDLFFRRSAAKR